MNPPQPDITRTIRDIVRTVRNADSNGFEQDEIIEDEAVHKLVTLVNEERIKELEQVYANWRKTYQSEKVMDRVENRIKELSQ